jgi:hypothetical protein
MTTGKLRRSLLVTLSCSLLACGAQGQSDNQANVNPDAQLLQEFQRRIEHYSDLHDRVEKQGPRLEETADPADIVAARETLAQNIRAARKDAREGDIFTPEIRRLFRRLMYPQLKGAEGVETKDVIKQDAPTAVTLKVNATYPENQPLPTVPPNLLAALPKLPDHLEYRIVKKDLILRDVDANLIVDFVPNAIR